jgi:hypothetical protein
MRYDFTRSGSFRGSSEFFSQDGGPWSQRATTDSAGGLEAHSSCLPRLRRHRTSQEKALLDVFLQCCLYLAAFLISYPVWLAANILSDSASYSLWIVVVLFTPLQGFLNFLVYIRSRRSPSTRPQHTRIPPKRRPAQATEVDAAHPNHGGGERQEIKVGGLPGTEPSCSVKFKDPSGGEEHSATRDETLSSFDASHRRDLIVDQNVATLEAMEPDDVIEDTYSVDGALERIEL